MAGSERVDFLSDAWLAHAHTVLQRLVREHGEKGRSFSVCEVFDDAPHNVAPDGRAAWRFYIEGTSVRVSRGRVDDTDLYIRADYQATLPAARLVYTPESLAGQAPVVEGREVRGDLSAAPSYLLELHNELAAITA